MATKKETVSQDNLRFYKLLRTAPQEALKIIGAGRLKNMSDINPMWRIQVMTETFGPCGIGWKYEITRQWNEPYGQEVATFCNVNLYIKVDDEWSDAIPGTGGSTFVAVESRGPRMSDECFKMALTDALSVAMKALGVAADVYYAKGVTAFETKYEQQAYAAEQQLQQSTQQVQSQQPQPVQQNEKVGVQTPLPEDLKKEIGACMTTDALMVVWSKYKPTYGGNANFTGAMTARKDQILNNGKK